MAFGLGFDKAKVMSAAEKYAAQGKITSAIDEYQKILHKDPKDLMVLSTVADLYARAGKNEEAIKRFNELAEKCLEAGMVPRAVAVYKRITKIAPDSVGTLLKLGELYSMQGLLRDAREHYLQAVEFHSRRNEKDKAREVFEKVLMLDMENPQLQVRMAELYAETGKKEEAVATYLGAVERYLDRSQPAEADAALQVVLRLDPQNPEARTLLGRAQLERGEFGKAVETLQAIPSLAAQKGPLNLLLHAYTQLGDRNKAKEIATQLFEGQDDFSGLEQISEALISGGQLDEALEIYQSAFQRLDTQRASSYLVEGLRKILAAQPTHAGALELLLKHYQAAGKIGEARETSEQLAHAYVAEGEWAKAREIYSELAAIEPENPQHLMLLRQVEEQMGISPPPSEAPTEPAPAMVAELSAPPAEAPPSPAALSPLEEQVVKDCLTESDLYKTYRQMGKAIEMLENGLAQLPGNLTLQEHLLPLYEEAQEFRKAAKCCETLTEAYVQLGDGERASRYGELMLSNQQKAEEKESQPAAASPAEGAAAAEPEGMEEFAPKAPATSLEEQAQVHEVDLSMEWASIAGTAEGPAPVAATSQEDNIVEEIEFYLQAGLAPEATAALDRLRQLSPAHPAISQFQERLMSAQPAAPPATVEPAAEPSPAVEFPAVPSEEIPALATSGESQTVVAEPEAVSSAPQLPEEFVPAPPSGTATPARQEIVLEEALPPLEAPPAAPAFELSLEEAEAQPQPVATPAPAPAQHKDRFADLAGELEDVLNLPGQPAREQTPAPPPPPAPSQPPAVAAAAAGPAAGAASRPKESSLEDVFAEFKAEMEEPAAAEDLETHYNMGVAFKEMALYDEAIGEFQKVHQLAAKYKDYSHVVQCCSLLATCFLGKGLPQLAVKWYQTALDSPGVDPESSLALLYEMASAYEIAGDRQAALKSFLEVYARNIDYRDVAERIHSIQQTQ
jgi:pilus assembly protein FimV